MTVEQLGLIIALGVLLSILAQVLFGEDLSEWADGAWEQWKERHRRKHG